MIKNPKDMITVVRNQTLVISNELSPEKGQTGESPLKIFDRFSRFPIAIINQSHMAVSGNIDVHQVADLAKRSTFAYQKAMELELQPFQAVTASAPASPGAAVEQPLSPAYTFRLKTGNLQGRTPAEILLENPKNVSVLERQNAFLKSRLQQYPANQEQIDAITEALQLFHTGQLAPMGNMEQPKEAVSSTLYPPFSLFQSGYRPLIRKKRVDGLSPVYEIRITWHFGMDYPVLVEIENYYALVEQTPQGLLNVLKSKGTADHVKNTMRLTAAEWMDCIQRMQSAMQTFENLYAFESYQLSRQAVQLNKQAARKTGNIEPSEAVSEKASVLAKTSEKMKQEPEQTDKPVTRSPAPNPRNQSVVQNRFSDHMERRNPGRAQRDPFLAAPISGVMVREPYGHGYAAYGTGY